MIWFRRSARRSTAGPRASAARAAAVLTIVALLGACNRLPFDEVEVDLAPRTPTAPIPAPTTALRVALAARISPKETAIHYTAVVDALGRELGRPIDLVHGRSYAEVNSLLLSGKLDMAFVCTGGYLELRAQRPDVSILAVPVVAGKMTYRSLIVVPQNRPTTGFADLRGRRFTFTDPLSQTGYLYPRSLILAHGATLDTFFSAHSFVGSHDRAIRAVRQGITDAAAVDSLVFEHLAQRHPEAVRGVRILSTSPEYGMPPIVAGPRTPAPVRDRWRAALLLLHTRPAVATALRELRIDRFAVPPADLYRSAEDLWRTTR